LSNFKILFVDNEELNRELLAEILSETYEIILVSSAQECLDTIETNRPDLIILDVMMPKMSGIECCERIKSNRDTHDIPVIFLSALNDIEDRLKGYFAGAEDYIAKPFDNQEIFVKIEASQRRHEKIKAATLEAKEAMSSTLQLVNEMGETNSVIAFLQQTFSCKSYEQLAEKIIATHADWGLEIAIEMTINDNRQYFYTDNTALPLEESAFDYIRSKGRLVDHGERTAVNYPRITIIIRNMPLNDPDLYGRIKDYIAIIAQGADSKIITLIAAENITAQQQNLISIMERTEKTISQLDREYKEQQKMSEHILTTIGSTVEESFINLGLTDEQEDFLTKVINDAEEQTALLFDAGLDLDKKFGQIITEINEAISVADIDTEVVVEDEVAEDTVAFF